MLKEIRLAEQKPNSEPLLMIQGQAQYRQCFV
jgi:hypothetical protein